MSVDRERLDKCIAKAIAELGELCDAVQIFVSYPVDGNTGTLHTGSGNWLARYGQVKEWLIKEEYRMHLEVDDQVDAEAEDNDELAE